MGVFLTIISSAWAQDAVLLEIKWTAGTTYNRHNVTLTEMLSGDSVISQNRMETDLSMTAIAHPRGVQVTMKNKRLQASMSAGGSDIGTYDSSNPDASTDTLRSMFTNALDNDVKFLFTEAGDVEVIEAAGSGDQLADKMMSQWMALMPSDAVSPGQTWKKTMEIPIGHPDNLSTQVTVTFVEIVEKEGKSLARITVSGAPAEGEKFKIKTYEADGLLDIELGQIVEADMKISGSGPGGMSIKVSITEKQVSVE